MHTLRHYQITLWISSSAMLQTCIAQQTFCRAYHSKYLFIRVLGIIDDSIEMAIKYRCACYHVDTKISCHNLEET